MLPCVDSDLGSTTPLTVPGTTSGFGDDASPSAGCFFPGVPVSDGEDVLYQFVAPATGTYVFDTLTPGIDTVLYVTDGCGGSELVCNDDFVEPQDPMNPNFGSFTGVELSAGEMVVVTVDSYDVSGGFTLDVAGPVPGGNCCAQRGLSAGCVDINVELCVCAFDDFCCTFGWDHLCVGEAIDFCSAQCG